MKTQAPLSYAPMLLALKATAYGAAMARMHPDRPRPPLEQLATMAAAHQERMDAAARELNVTPAAAANERAQRMRRMETRLAGVMPTTTRKD